MEFVDYKCLESLLIATEGTINYPKELNLYQFTTNGKFDQSTKANINSFFENSDWIKKLNESFYEILTSPKYDQKFKSFCDKTGYKLSMFKIYLLTVYFNDNNKNVINNNVYINITFEDIDRYDCPGFVSLVKPILSYIIKTEMGSNWILEGSEYPTDFIIYRKLNSEEIKSLRIIQKSNNEIRKQQAETARNAKAARTQKINELYEQELKKCSEAFYNQSLKDQAFEILKYYTFNRKCYYDEYSLDIMIPNELNIIKSTRLKRDEKMFAFDYIQPNSFDINSKPIQNKLTCYAIANKESDYKKLVKLYYINYIRRDSATFNTYIKSKVLDKI